MSGSFDSMDKAISSDLQDTVRISGGRFAQSPFFHLYASEKTRLGVAAERFYPADNGEDVVATYWALRRQAVLFDVPERPWRIEGADAVPFLERLLARRVGDLEPGRGRYAIACTAEGGTFMDGILFRLDQRSFWYVQADGALEAWLIAQREGFDARISDPHSRVLQIQGPNSLKIMARASAGAIDASMAYFRSGFYDLGGQRLFVSRTGWTGELGYEIYTQGDATDCDRLWRHLFDCGVEHGLVFGSLAAMGIRRIEAGILDNISDFDTTMTPFAAGLGNFIDLDKPGFIGREALLAADRRKRLYGLKCRAVAPNAGELVLDNGEPVGRVTTGEWSPYLESGIGYVRFDHAGDWSGKSLSIESSPGGPAGCEIIDLPFYDREKRIPRATGAQQA